MTVKKKRRYDRHMRKADVSVLFNLYVVNQGKKELDNEVMLKALSGDYETFQSLWPRAEQWWVSLVS